MLTCPILKQYKVTSVALQNFKKTFVNTQNNNLVPIQDRGFRYMMSSKDDDGKW